MADFSAVTVTDDNGVIHLHGQAKETSTQTVHVTSTIVAQDGSTESVETDGTRQVTTSVATSLQAVTDDAGRTYVIAADGQSATLQGS